MKLKPKNWMKFQHYKDRNPPWIKLHKEMLNDPDFMSLSLACIGLAQLLWLLASESKTGEIDASEKKLTFRLRKPWSEIKKNLNTLIDSGFFVVLADARGVLAYDTESCSEGETETETETERLFSEFWSEYPRKVGKPDAKKKFSTLVKEFDLIMDGLRRYKKTYDWQKENGQYIPYPATFLNQRRWEDEVTPAKPRQQKQTREELMKIYGSA